MAVTTTGSKLYSASETEDTLVDLTEQLIGRGGGARQVHQISKLSYLNLGGNRHLRGRKYIPKEGVMLRALIKRAGRGPMELVDFEREFGNIFEDMNRTFGSMFRRGPFMSTVTRSGFPKTNIRRDKEDAIFEIAIPYYEPEDIDVNLTNEILTVTGKAAEDSNEYEVQEVARRAFQRSWPVTGAKPDDLSAEYDKGVLFIRVKGLYRSEKERYEGCKIEVKKRT